MTGRCLVPDDDILASVRLLAQTLGRTPMAKDWREHGCRPCHETLLSRWGTWDGVVAAAGLPAIEPPAGWQAGNGRRRYWTDERIAEGLRQLHQELGRVPTDREYQSVTKGRPDLPQVEQVRRYAGKGRGSWKLAFHLAGIRVTRLRAYATWTDEEVEFLLENAGLLTLKQIGRRLERSWACCKRKLYDLGVRARDARGYYTAMVLAQEFDIPVSRVYQGIHEGILEARRPFDRPYWQIDPDSVERARDWLTRPKETHTSTPPVTVDWYRQHNLRRNGEGRIIGRRTGTRRALPA